MTIAAKRAYEAPAADDGYRVLIDRLWPRGVRKDAARIDRWAKELAPSAELREWFGHDPQRWADFQRRYRAELRRAPAQAALGELRELARRGPVTLVYAAKDSERCNAAVVRALISRSLARDPVRAPRR